MYISYFLSTLKMKKCPLQVNIELLDLLICMLGKIINRGSNIDR